MGGFKRKQIQVKTKNQVSITQNSGFPLKTCENDDRTKACLIVIANHGGFSRGDGEPRTPAISSLVSGRLPRR